MLVGLSCPGQGLINFANGPTTLVSQGGFPIGYPVGGVYVNPAGSYYFALLMAPAGTTNPVEFSFANAYATNTSNPGEILGESNMAVPGWPSDVTKAYMVAGWSANLGGPSWNQGWLSGRFSQAGWFGISAIGTGVPGNLFGGSTGIQIGWELLPVGAVPEPSSLVTAIMGAGILIVASRWNGHLH